MLHTHRRLAALAVAIPLVAGLVAGCGDDEDKDKAAANAPCPANISSTKSFSCCSFLSS